MGEIQALIADNGIQLLDVALVAVVIYYVLVLLRGVRNFALLQMLAVLGIVYVLCKYLKLATLAFLLEKFLVLVPLVMLVIFAPELRKLLEGLSKNWKLIGMVMPEGSKPAPLPDSSGMEVVTQTALELAQAQIGALIVLDSSNEVESLTVSGTRLDALLSTELLLGLFSQSNPLHDGAVVIRNWRVEQAGCFLPISENPNLPPQLGTRHRAALGLTEKSSAVVIVVSEERGSVSICYRGRIALDLTAQQFNEQLEALVEHHENTVTLVPRAA